MSIFDNPNFRPLDRVAGKITINVTNSGVGFSKQVLSRLEYSHYVQIFINTVDKQLGIKKCEEDSPNAVGFVPPKKEKVDALRWNNPAFRKDIDSLVSEELANGNYSCEGEYYPEEKAVLFDFKNAYAANSKEEDDN